MFSSKKIKKLEDEIYRLSNQLSDLRNMLNVIHNKFEIEKSRAEDIIEKNIPKNILKFKPEINKDFIAFKINIFKYNEEKELLIWKEDKYWAYPEDQELPTHWISEVER